jgi:hypothetical protein
MATVLKVRGARIWPYSTLDDGKLEVVVLFTTLPATQSALRSAAKLADGLSAKIRLLVPSVVPYPLPLNQPPVSPQVLGRKLRDLAQQAEVPCTIDIRLCRDRWDAVGQALSARSLVVIGQKPHWWQRSERKLVDRLLRDGHQLVYAESRTLYA